LEISYNRFDHHTAPGMWSGSYIKTWFDGKEVAKRLWIQHNLLPNIFREANETRIGTANPYADDPRLALTHEPGGTGPNTDACVLHLG